MNAKIKICPKKTLPAAPYTNYPLTYEMLSTLRPEREQLGKA